MSRSILLERIRSACQMARAAELPTAAPAFPTFKDPVGRFASELEAVGGIFLDVRRPQALLEVLSRVLEENEASEIIWESREVLLDHGLPHRFGDPDLFEKGGLVFSSHFRGRVTDPIIVQGRTRHSDNLYKVAVTASTAAFGIAETGTIALETRKGTGRMLSFLPQLHLVFLCEQNLVMNLAEVFERHRPGASGSAFTLVTGPSRTADIEKTLVLGVHGPQKLYVFFTC